MRTNTTQARGQAELLRDARRAVFKAKDRLLGANTPAETLRRSALVLKPTDFDDVVLERGTDLLCGYPTCSERMDAQSVKLPSRISVLAAAGAGARGVTARWV